jgi:hypothetical protein
MINPPSNNLSMSKPNIKFVYTGQFRSEVLNPLPRCSNCRKDPPN